MKSATEVEALHARGIAAFQRGDRPVAIEALRAAVEARPDESRYHCNLGKALLDAGEFDAAIEALQASLALRDDYPTAKFNLVAAFIAAERPEDARPLLDNLIEGDPSNAQYHGAKADIDRLLGDWRRAIRGYRAALDLDDALFAAHSNLGVLLVLLGQGKEALEHCERAVELAPERGQTWLNLGRCLTLLERYEEAMEAFAEGFDRSPDSALLCAEIGRLWHLAGDESEAADWCRRALTLDPRCADALAIFAQVLLATGDAAGANHLLVEGLKAHPDSVELRRIRAQALWEEGDVESALSDLTDAMAREPQNARLLSMKGQILSSAGRTEEAMEVFQSALALQPTAVPALHGLATRARGELDAELTRRMNELLEKDRLRSASRAMLHNGLSYVEHAHQHWEAAAQHMAKANALQWTHRSERDWDYDQDQHAAFCARTRLTFDAEGARDTDFGNRSTLPVFIVGMPRSGTTLSEQILARHPHVLGIGERNFASQAFHSCQTEASRNARDGAFEFLAPTQCKIVIEQHLHRLEELRERSGKDGITRIVDKMPDNYNLLGWILKSFPEARVIHCRRNLRDVALSCWQTQFGRIQWASRWSDLAHRIDCYREMMAHWRAVAAGRFLEIDYESLVHDQERVTRQMLDWLALGWHADCLDFQRSSSVVRTASINQVRQPLYRSSVQRWKHYAPHIPELISIPEGQLH